MRHSQVLLCHAFTRSRMPPSRLSLPRRLSQDRPWRSRAPPKPRGLAGLLPRPRRVASRLAPWPAAFAAFRIVPFEIFLLISEVTIISNCLEILANLKTSRSIIRFRYRSTIYSSKVRFIFIVSFFIHSTSIPSLRVYTVV